MEIEDELKKAKKEPEELEKLKIRYTTEVDDVREKLEKALGMKKGDAGIEEEEEKKVVKKKGAGTKRLKRKRDVSEDGEMRDQGPKEARLDGSGLLEEGYSLYQYDTDKWRGILLMVAAAELGDAWCLKDRLAAGARRSLDGTGHHPEDILERCCDLCSRCLE